MIVLLPVSRFRITYEVAAGRPFSQLERMVLRAAHEGACDLVALEQTFQVHRRILIEALVTLTQAGWLSVSGPGGGGFLLTSEGRDAAASDRPPSTTAVSARRMFVVMERLTGALVSNDEVRFSTRRELEKVWDSSLLLRPEVLENSIDEGQVQHLLRRGQGEWLRWIGPIDMVSKNAHWIAVNVDPDAGTVVGLPDSWRLRLGSVVVEEARRLAHTVPAPAKTLTWTSPRFGSSRALATDQREGQRLAPGVWPVQFSAGDLAFTAAEHGSILVGALREARSSVFAASAFLSAASLEGILQDVWAALERGVDIDLLWGYSADDAGMSSNIDWLKKLAYDARRAELQGMLRFNHTPSGSHAKLLVHDSPEGLRAWVGSFNWLSAFVPVQRGQGPTNASLRLSEPAAIAALVRCAAGLWSSTESESLSSTADRWRRIAGDLEMGVAQAAQRDDALPRGDTVRLVLDREHEILLRELSTTAQTRLLVCSHRIGVAAEARLITASGLVASRSLRVRYGQADVAEDALGRVIAGVVGSGGTLTQVSGLHAKVVVSDTSACISSYNFLSADPFGKAARARELGVLVESPLLADRLWETIA